MSHKGQFDRVCVVLVGARNPLNIGAAARAMSNFGFQQLRLVKPYDKSYREARSAVGASEVLARAKQYETVGEAVADATLVVGTSVARDRELQHPLKRIEVGGRLITKELSSGRVAILFGSEKFGLLNSDLSHCHWIMRIPTRQEHGAMNLGQAVAVCLYELVRNPANRSISARAKLAPASQQERLTQSLLRALQSSGYVKPGASIATEEKVRRLVRRLRLDREDAETLQGMLRKVLWKIEAT